MANKTFDLDDYISQRKEKDPEFAKDFDTGYEEFKIGMMIKEMRLERFLMRIKVNIIQEEVDI